MNGPYPKGKLKSENSNNWSKMTAGKTYRIKTTVVDGDRSVIHAGTTFKFLGNFFSGFGGVMGVVVSLDGQNEWAIPFRFDEKGDSDMIETLSTYVEEVSLDRDAH